MAYLLQCLSLDFGGTEKDMNEVTTESVDSIFYKQQIRSSREKPAENILKTLS